MNLTTSPNDYNQDEGGGTSAVIAVEGTDLPDTILADWVYVAGNLRRAIITANGLWKHSPLPSFGQ